MAENTLSENITQAISDFDDIKQAIEAKGVTIPSGTPTSDYADLIGDIPSGDNTQFIDLIERTATSIEVPQETTHIGSYAFYYCTSLTRLTLPDSLTRIDSYAFSNCTSLTRLTLPDSLTHIGSYAFSNCKSLTELTLPDSLTKIGSYAFSNCTSLTELTLPDSLTRIDSYAFSNCTSLTELTLPDSLTRIDSSVFSNCTSLTELTLAQGFNCNNLNLSASTKYSVDTIVGWLNALADRTGNTAYTLTIGSTNLSKLTADQIAVATNKNWNLA